MHSKWEALPGCQVGLPIWGWDPSTPETCHALVMSRRFGPVGTSDKHQYLKPGAVAASDITSLGGR